MGINAACARLFQRKAVPALLTRVCVYTLLVAVFELRIRKQYFVSFVVGMATCDALCYMESLRRCASVKLPCCCSRNASSGCCGRVSTVATFLFTLVVMYLGAAPPEGEGMMRPPGTQRLLRRGHELQLGACCLLVLVTVASSAQRCLRSRWLVWLGRRSVAMFV